MYYCVISCSNLITMSYFGQCLYSLKYVCLILRTTHKRTILKRKQSNSKYTSIMLNKNDMH